MIRGIRIALLLALFSALLLSGCAVESDRSEKPVGADWSRALRLGRATLKQPVALAVDGARHVHLVWYDGQLNYAHLDKGAQVVTNAPLAIDTPNPRRPQLVVDGEDSVHLAWLSRREGIQELYHQALYPPERATAPRLISAAGEDVSGFRIYLAPSGDLSFLWASVRPDGTQGVTHARLADPAGRTPLAQPGIDPAVLVDAEGTVHVAWLRERGLTARALYYATLADQGAGPALAPAGGVRVAEFEYGEGAVYYGPVIGRDRDAVYLLWAVQNLGGGLTPTAAFSYYVAFPPGEAQVVRPAAISLPTTDQPEYQGYRGHAGLSQLDLLSPADLSYSSEFVSAPAVVSLPGGDLVVALSLMTASQARSEIQLATAVLADREQVGYQLASRTENASLVPSIAADAGGGLHLAWIDTAGFREYDVYYASTAPEARQWLDRTSRDDLVLGAGRIVFGVFSGVGLLPIAGVWSFPALIFVVAFFIITGQEEMARTPTRIGFAIAVAIYAGMKVLLLPGLFAGTPFLHAAPRSWAVAIGIAIPVLILLVALGATWLYVRRAQRATIFKAIVTMILVDVGLTLVLYAPGFFRGA